MSAMPTLPADRDQPCLSPARTVYDLEGRPIGNVQAPTARTLVGMGAGTVLLVRPVESVRS